MRNMADGLSKSVLKEKTLNFESWTKIQFGEVFEKQVVSTADKVQMPQALIENLFTAFAFQFPDLC